MKKNILILIVCYFFAGSFCLADFIENKGQFPDEVRFVYRSTNMTVFVQSDKLIFDSYAVNRGESVSGFVDEMRFNNSNSSVVTIGVKSKDYSMNFIGDELNTANAFSECIIKDLWSGIDLRLYEENSKFRYDFIVNPNSNPDDIELEFSEDVKLSENVIYNDYLKHEDLQVYQLSDSKKELIAGSFVLTDNKVKFAVENYDRKNTLVIDPIVYSTYAGGGQADEITDMYVDGSGNVYVCGFTSASDYPTTTGAYDKTMNGQVDAFVSKLSADGSELLYSTYIGGSMEDRAYGIEVDGSGNVFICGYTASDNFPVTIGSYDETYNGGFDGFVLGLNSSGSSLIFSTFIGGAEYDELKGIDLNGSGIVAAGKTYSADFPVTSGVYDETFNGGQDLVAIQLDNTGANLQFSTFIGGTDIDVAYNVCYDNAGSVIVLGESVSNDFPTTSGAYQESLNGEADVTVSKLNSSATSLVFSTFLGGNSYDSGKDLIIDNSNNIYLCGETQSMNFPVSGGTYDISFNGQSDGFISRLSSNGVSLMASTFIGSTTDDKLYGLNFDTQNNIIVCGQSNSTHYPVSGNALYKDLVGSEDGVVSVITNNLTTLSYSSFYGGTSTDVINNIAGVNQNELIFSGYTTSNDLPVGSGSYDESFNGAIDGFIAGIDGLDFPIITVSGLNDFYCAGAYIDVEYTVSSDFNSGNEFIVEQSDGFGNFTNPVEIGRITAVGSGIIPAQFDKSSSQNNNYRIRVRATNPEVTSDNNGHNIRLDELPNMEITGDTIPCAQEIVQYSCEDEPDISIEWQVEGGIFIDSHLVPQVEIEWGIEPEGTLTLIKKNTLTDCADTVRVDIDIKYPPYTEIGWGNETPCIADISEYTAASSTVSQNEWFVSGGILLDETTMLKAVVLWTQEGEGWVELRKTNEFGCVGSDRKVVNVSPVPFAQINGDDKVVENETYVYKTDYEFDVRSIWRVQGGTIVGDNTIDTIVVNWGDKGTGQVRLIRYYAMTDCADTAFMEIEINEGVPDSDISGEGDVCKSSIESYYAEFVPNVSIKWYVEKGAIIGANNQFSVTVNWREAGKGYIRFEMESLESGDTNSSTLEIVVREAPEITFTDAPNYCLNDGPYLLDIGRPEGGNYSGSGVNENILFPEVVGVGKHQINYNYTDEYGCSNSLVTEIEVFSNPEPATIDIDNGTLVSSYDFGNKWFFDDEIIEGAIEKRHNPTKSGKYTVQHTDSNGCKSEMLNGVLVGVENALEYDVKLFPNPMKDKFNIELTGFQYKKILISMKDLLGKELLRYNEYISENTYIKTFDLKNLSNGVYIINLIYDNNVVIEKIVVDR